MILGDSLVYVDGDGLRSSFERALRERGALVRLVGTQAHFRETGTMPGPTYSRGPFETEYAEHEGHGGHTIAQAAADYAAAWPVCGVPDCVLLRTGTNDVYWQGVAIHAGTITQAVALASMQADMTALVAALLASGVRLVGVGDIPHIGTLKPAPAMPVETNALADAWNAALDAFVTALPHGAAQVVSAAHYTAQLSNADFVNPLGVPTNDYIHPSIQGNTSMGVAASRWLLSVATLPPCRPTPRRATSYGLARAHVAMVAAADRVELPATLTAMVLPAAGSFEVELDYYCTALTGAAELRPIYQYSSTTWADGFAIYQSDGGHLRLYFKGLGMIAAQGQPVVFAANRWHRIRVRIDATRQRCAVMVNAQIVDDFAMGGALDLSGAAQKTFLGRPSALGGSGALGYYGRLAVHAGTGLGTWDDFAQHAAEDYYSSVRAPGTQGEVMLCEGTGTAVVESVSGVSTAVALVGATWAALGAAPKWCEQGSEPLTVRGASSVLINGDTLSHDASEEPLTVSLLASTSGLDAARPAASAVPDGHKYTATDTGVTYECLGGVWRVASAHYCADRCAIAGWYTNHGLYCTASPTTEPDLADGTALALCWYSPAAPAGATVKTLLHHGNTANTRGFSVLFSRTAGHLSLLEVLLIGAAYVDIGVTEFASPAHHCLLIAITGGNLRCSLDGEAVVATAIPGGYVPPNTADPISVGIRADGALSIVDGSAEFVSMYPFTGISADTGVLDPLLRAASLEGQATGRVTAAVGTLGAPLHASWWAAGAVHYTATRAGGASPVEWFPGGTPGTASTILRKRAR